MIDELIALLTAQAHQQEAEAKKMARHGGKRAETVTVGEYQRELQRNGRPRTS